MATGILQTKLYIPPVRAGQVPRPSLTERLEAGFRAGHCLALVSAPAGFGKTTVLAGWVAETHKQAAWLSLDEADNDPIRFFSHLIAALETLQPGLGSGAWNLLLSTQPPAILAVLTALLNDLTHLPVRAALVLDDYHTITEPAVHEWVAFLLDHLPPQLELVVATRADPPLPVHRLRARGQLTEIRAADLRFTTGEAVSFLGSMGVRLAPADVAALEARTEGWIVGLQLAAISMQGRADLRAFVAAFSGSHHYVLEYLTEEVLSRQPQPVQDFLLQTSILDRLCAPLCDAVTGREDSVAMLAYLERANLFVIPLDDDHRWHRYHRLFAELLTNRLRQAMPQATIDELHGRASRWHAQNGSLDEAVRHGLAARIYAEVAALAEQAARANMLNGRVATLERWIAALPEELWRARPRLLIYLGWAQFIDGRLEAAGATLQDARKALESLPPSADTSALRGELAAVLARRAALVGEPAQAIEAAQEALRYLPAEDFGSRTRVAAAMGMAYGIEGEATKAGQALGEAVDLALRTGNLFLAEHALSLRATGQTYSGQLHNAVACYRQIVELAARPQAPAFLAGPGLVGLGRIALEQNDLNAAEQYLAQGIKLCQQGGQAGDWFSGQVAESRLRQARGDVEGAWAALRLAEQIYQVSASALMAVLLVAEQVRMSLVQADVESAGRYLNRLPTGDRLPSVLHEARQVILARVLLAQRQAGRALALLEPLLSPAEQAGRLGRVLEQRLLMALGLHSQGQRAAALASLQRSLALAEPEGYVRLFLDEGAPVEELLAAFSGQPSVSPHLQRYAAKLLEAFQAGRPAGEAGSHAVAPATELVEPLTARELEVLRLIAEGCSNEEIAMRLVVTLNTVKKHTSNIFGKLAVASRTQAVARARRMGLLRA